MFISVFGFLIIWMADHIFVLSNQNSDLAGHMFFQNKNKKLFAGLSHMLGKDESHNGHQ